jgi:autophagy-related protein 9
MTSNLLSRFLPTHPSGRSIYDDLRAHDGAESDADVEERAGMAIDEENLGYHDDDLRNADLFNGEDSRITTESTAFLAGQQNTRTQGVGGPRRKKPQSGWLAQSPRLLEEDGDDDVPASLLIEGNENPGPDSPNRPRIKEAKSKRRRPAIPGPSNRETRAHWEAAQAQQRLHRDEEERVSTTRQAEPAAKLLAGSPRDKAMWRWINVVNLDNFMLQVYNYYTGSGIWCIVLFKVLDLLLVYTIIPSGHH